MEASDARDARDAAGMSTFIVRLDSDREPGAAAGGQGGRPPGVTRVAVKDLIDMAGLPTTSGSKVIASSCAPAAADAACLAGIRAAEARGEAMIVGKTNLHELAFGVSGVNPWFGTPVNPLDPRLVPGGSSSGSAVAVATDEADVGIGSDTGGSIRIPAACCGIVGLKTTRGRIALDGVQALSPSLDTVGPMGATVEATGRGMELLLPGFEWRQRAGATRIGRVRLPAEEWVDQAIDEALAGWVARGGGPGGSGSGGSGSGGSAGSGSGGSGSGGSAGSGRSAGGAVEVVELELPGWEAANEAVGIILVAEAWSVHHDLWAEHRPGLSGEVAQRLEMGSLIGPEEVASAWEEARRWVDQLARAFASVDLIALPVLAEGPPPLEDAGRMGAIRHTAPINLAGVPALAMPVGGGPVPASLQLVAPAYGEEMLLATAQAIERG